MDGQNTAQRPPTFGEKAVGLTFNPGGNESVTTIKQLYADVIDFLQSERSKLPAGLVSPEDKEKMRMLSISITETQTAQMWAVKAITWKD